MDEYFEDLERARAPSQTAGLPDVSDAVERIAREALVQESRGVFATGPCVGGKCTGRYVPVRLFVGTRNEGLPRVRGKNLHICITQTCRLSEEVHGEDVTEEFRKAGALAVQPSASGGGLYWCARHTRAHVCGRGRCKMTHRTPLGFECCVLSGQTVGQAVEFAYGSGVAIPIATAQPVERVSRSSAAAAPSPLDALVRRSGPQRIAPQAPPLSGEYIDLDAPADDLFPDDGESNTFRDGFARDMRIAYTQFYATAYHIIFSEYRIQLERATEDERITEAVQRIKQYRVDRAKAEMPVDVMVCRQLQDCALSKSKRIYPYLHVPPHGICRMNAYYAAVCMEFFIQLTWQITALLEGSAKMPFKMKQSLERFLAFNVADVAPNVLDILHEGLRIHKQVIVQAEPLFHDLFPESLTLDKLGIKQKTCTEVKKLLKHCIILIVEAKKPLSSIQTTHLDLNSVLRDLDTPVLSLFFAARRARLGLE